MHALVAALLDLLRRLVFALGIFACGGSKNIDMLRASSIVVGRDRDSSLVLVLVKCDPVVALQVSTSKLPLIELRRSMVPAVVV